MLTRPATVRTVRAESRVLGEALEPAHEQRQLAPRDVLEEQPVIEHGAGGDRLVARKRQQHRDVAPQQLRLGPGSVRLDPTRRLERAFELGGVFHRPPRLPDLPGELANFPRRLAPPAVGHDALEHRGALVGVYHLEQLRIGGGIAPCTVDADRLHRLVGQRRADIEPAVDPADRRAARSEQRQEGVGLEIFRALAQAYANLLARPLHAPEP